MIEFDKKAPWRKSAQKRNHGVERFTYTESNSTPGGDVLHENTPQDVVWLILYSQTLCAKLRLWWRGFQPVSKAKQKRKTQPAKAMS